MKRSIPVLAAAVISGLFLLSCSSSGAGGDSGSTGGALSVDEVGTALFLANDSLYGKDSSSTSTRASVLSSEPVSAIPVGGTISASSSNGGSAAFAYTVDTTTYAYSGKAAYTDFQVTADDGTYYTLNGEIATTMAFKPFGFTVKGSVSIAKGIAAADTYTVDLAAALTDTTMALKGSVGTATLDLDLAYETVLLSSVR